MLDPVLSDMGMVATNPVAVSTIKAKYRWGGSCLQAGSLPDVPCSKVSVHVQEEESVGYGFHCGFHPPVDSVSEMASLKNHFSEA